MRRFQIVGVVALAVVVSLVSAGSTSAQVTLDPEWPENPRTFGGDLDDHAYSVQQTTDGGYIVAGSYGWDRLSAPDVYLMKLDAQGQLDPAWDSNPRTFGGDSLDEAYSAQQTSEGGYIVAGQTWSFRNGGEVYLIKLDSAGNLDPAWDPNPKTFGSGVAYSVQQTTDGGYVVAGSTGAGGDVYLCKLDSQGGLDPTWETNPTTFGGEDDDYATSVQQTSDGGYILAGDTWRPWLGGNGDVDFYVIKIDALGNLDPAWATNPRTFGSGGLWDLAHSVQEAVDGGYVVAGSTECLGGEGVYLIKLDAGGDLDTAWDPNPITFCDGTGSSTQETSDGGYIVAGYTSHFGAEGYDVFLVKLDPRGNLDAAWNPNPRIVGGAGFDAAFSIRQTTDGGYIVAGSTDSFGAGGADVLLLKLAPARHFLRGDCDGNASFSGITDAVFLLEYLFRSGPKPACLAACDANGDGSTGGVTDAVYILQHAFFGTEPPPKPFPTCGAGQLWTDGPLTCETEPPCP